MVATADDALTPTDYDIAAAVDELLSGREEVPAGPGSSGNLIASSG